MFYPEGVNGKDYTTLRCLAAYYLYECWPVPEWKMICAMYGRAIDDLTSDSYEVREAFYISYQFKYWPTYDWLVEMTPKLAAKAGADPLIVRDLLLHEYDDDFLYDLVSD